MRVLTRGIRKPEHSCEGRAYEVRSHLMRLSFFSSDGSGAALPLPRRALSGNEVGKTPPATDHSSLHSNDSARDGLRETYAGR